MQQHLQEPGVLAIYLFGTVAACFHLGNGLFGFAIHWGLATTRDAQRRAARLGFAVFVILALVGVDALLSFTNHPLRLFGHPPDTFAVRGAGSR
jgi:succinate dehydrogenase / fumarate reductase cytochrome b subunit